MARLLFAAVCLLTTMSAQSQPLPEKRFQLGKILLVEKFHALSEEKERVLVVARSPELRTEILHIAKALFPDIMGAPGHKRSANAPVVLAFDDYRKRGSAEPLIQADIRGQDAVVYRYVNNSPSAPSGREETKTSVPGKIFSEGLWGDSMEPPPQHVMQLGRIYVIEAYSSVGGEMTYVFAATKDKRDEILSISKAMFPDIMGAPGHHQRSDRPRVWMLNEYLEWRSINLWPSWQTEKLRLTLKKALQGSDAFVQRWTSTRLSNN